MRLEQNIECRIIINESFDGMEQVEVNVIANNLTLGIVYVKQGVENNYRFFLQSGRMFDSLAEAVAEIIYCSRQKLSCFEQEVLRVQATVDRNIFWNRLLEEKWGFVASMTCPWAEF